MAPYSGMRNRCRNLKSRWRSLVLGLVAAAGAFWSFGLGPWAVAPNAHADVLTDLFGLMIEPVVAGSSGISPTEFLDTSMLDAALSDSPATSNAWDNLRF